MSPHTLSTPSYIVPLLNPNYSHLTVPSVWTLTDKNLGRARQRSAAGGDVNVTLLPQLMPGHAARSARQAGLLIFHPCGQPGEGSPLENAWSGDRGGAGGFSQRGGRSTALSILAASFCQGSQQVESCWEPWGRRRRWAGGRAPWPREGSAPPTLGTANNTANQGEGKQKQPKTSYPESL